MLLLAGEESSVTAIKTANKTTIFVYFYPRWFI